MQQKIEIFAFPIAILKMRWPNVILASVTKSIFLENLQYCEIFLACFRHIYFYFWSKQQFHIHYLTEMSVLKKNNFFLYIPETTEWHHRTFFCSFYLIRQCSFPKKNADWDQNCWYIFNVQRWPHWLIVSSHQTGVSQSKSMASHENNVSLFLVKISRFFI